MNRRALKNYCIEIGLKKRNSSFFVRICFSIPSYLLMNGDGLIGIKTSIQTNANISVYMHIVSDAHVGKVCAGKCITGVYCRSAIQCFRFRAFSYIIAA